MAMSVRMFRANVWRKDKQGKKNLVPIFQLRKVNNKGNLGRILLEADSPEEIKTKLEKLSNDKE